MGSVKEMSVLTSLRRETFYTIMSMLI